MIPFEDDEDAWPDEPSEFDPDSLGPDAPEPPDPTPEHSEVVEAAEEVPGGLFRAFWASVLSLNVALAALAVGGMMIYFQRDYETGGLVFLIGCVAAAGTLRYYWGVKTGRYGTENGADDGLTDERGEP